MYSTAQTVYLYITHTSVYVLTVQYTAPPIQPKIGKHMVYGAVLLKCLP